MKMTNLFKLELNTLEMFYVVALFIHKRQIHRVGT